MISNNHWIHIKYNKYERPTSELYIRTQTEYIHEIYKYMYQIVISIILSPYFDIDDNLLGGS